MDFANLQIEYENLSQMSRKSVTSINNLNSYIKNVQKGTESSISLIKSACEKMYLDMKRNDNKSNISNSIKIFNSEIHEKSNMIKSIMKKYESELIEPLSFFSKDVYSSFTNCLSRLKSLISYIQDKKNQLDKLKNKYFDACKAIQDKEKTILKMDASNSNKIISAYENLANEKQVAEELCQEYKKEVDNVNQVFHFHEEKYFQIIEEMRNNEEKTIFFMKCSLEKYAIIENEINIIRQETMRMINDCLIGIDVDKDFKIFNDYLDQSGIDKKERFPRQEFVNYEIFKRNIESIVNNNSLLIMTTSQEESFIISENDVGCIEKNHLLSHIQEIDNNINEFLLNIYSNKKIDDELENKINQYLSSHKLKHIHSQTNNNSSININHSLSEIDFSVRLIDMILIKAKSRTVLDFYNKSNFLIFSEVIKKIFEIISNDENNFELYFALLFIASKSRFFDISTLNSIYLCSVLSTYVEIRDLVSVSSFWKKLILFKFDKKNLSSEKEIVLKYKEFLSNQQKLSNVQSASTSSLILNFGSKVKNYLVKQVQSETKLNTEYMDLLRKMINSNLINVIKEFIPHMCFYKLSNEKTFCLISEVVNSYYNEVESGYEEDVLNKLAYLKMIININKYSIKNRSSQLSSGCVFIEKFRLVYYEQLSELNHLLFDGSISRNEYSLLLSIPYISPLTSKYFSINNMLSPLIKKQFLKNVLYSQNQSLEISQRILIWNELLRVSKLEEVYKYSTLREEVDGFITNKDIINNKLRKAFETIILDVKRTFFSIDIDEKREKIERILQTILYINPAITYCQGMNFIVAFLLEISNNEEKAFYLTLGLFLNTNYCELFYNELAKLKKLFVVFEKALNLKLPECYHYLNSCGINSSFYVSSWFITLFTITYPNIIDISNPLFLLKIFEMFILNGWQSIVLTGIVLIKGFSENILSLKFDDLLNLLLSDIIRAGHIQNHNYDKFLGRFEEIEYSLEVHKLIEDICDVEEKSKLK